MANTYFIGLRATSDVVANEHPQNWRQGIMRLFPNGTATLTALTALMAKRKPDSPVFHWWEDDLPTQRAAITGIYTDAALTAGYAAGAVAGQILYFKMTAAHVAFFREGQQVLLRDASDYTVDVNGKVIDVVANGASSYIAVRLLEDDDNSALGDLSDCDTALVIGTINPEGGTRPDSVTYSPEDFYNYTQIFRDPIDLTRTMLETNLRTEQAYPKAKKDALELHSIQMEKAFLWGIRTSNTGVNGKPERTTGGIIPAIKTLNLNVDDYTTNADYHGVDWVDGGDAWLDGMLEQIFRFGGSERLCFAGSGAMLGIHRLVKSLGQYNISEVTTTWGLSVDKWKTPFGTMYVKTHPLFSYEPTNRNSMVLFEPKNLTYCYLTDTMYKPDRIWREGGGTGKDGPSEEWLTECGLEFHFPQTAGYLNGVGIDHST